VLILPENVTLTSGNNETYVGTINAGSDITVAWMVIFKDSATYNLQVRASGLDSTNNPCFASQSVTVMVGEQLSPISNTVFWALFAALLLTGAVAIAFLVLRKPKGPKP
jgi:hypothetical protein